MVGENGPFTLLLGFPGGSDVKESSCNAGDLGSIPGSGRSNREGNGYPLQYSCLENSKDSRIWWFTVYGVTVVHGLQPIGAVWITSWNQDCHEKYEQPQICRWYHSNGRKQRGTKQPLDDSERGEWKRWKWKRFPRWNLQGCLFILLGWVLTVAWRPLLPQFLPPSQGV